MLALCCVCVVFIITVVVHWTLFAIIGGKNYVFTQMPVRIAYAQHCKGTEIVLTLLLRSTLEN